MAKNSLGQLEDNRSQEQRQIAARDAIMSSFASSAQQGAPEFSEAQRRVIADAVLAGVKVMNLNLNFVR